MSATVIHVRLRVNPSYLRVNMAERLPVEIEEPCQIFHEGLFAVEESVRTLTETSIQDMNASLGLGLIS